METEVLAALLTGTTALGVALMNAYFGRGSQARLASLEKHKATYQAQIEAQKAHYQRILEEYRTAQQHDLERVKAELGEQRAERDAFREYQYDARKRLYVDCEPLLLQFHFTAEDARSRIRNLAGASRNGNLGAGGWLSRGYYRLSTYYKLLAPLALFRILNGRLGLIDFTLDQRIYKQYLLARCLYEVLGDDFALAKACGIAGYAPHAKGAQELREQDPVHYWQQGIPEGILANAVDALICTDGQQRDRLRTFGDFERAYTAETETVKPPIDRIDYLFRDFSPDARPILWAALLAMAQLYQVLLDEGAMSGDNASTQTAVIPKQLEWRSDEAADPAASLALFTGAKKYALDALQQRMAKV